VKITTQPSISRLRVLKPRCRKTTPAALENRGRFNLENDNLLWLKNAFFPSSKKPLFRKVESPSLGSHAPSIPDYFGIPAYGPFFPGDPNPSPPRAPVKALLFPPGLLHTHAISSPTPPRQPTSTTSARKRKWARRPRCPTSPQPKPTNYKGYFFEWNTKDKGRKFHAAERQTTRLNRSNLFLVRSRKPSNGKLHIANQKQHQRRSPIP